MSHARELVKGSFYGLALRVASVLVTFFFNVLLVRALGAEQVGIYYLSIAILSIAVVLVNVGLENGSIRFSSVLIANRNWDDLGSLVRRAGGIVLFLSLVCAGLVLVATSAGLAAFLSKPGLAEALRFVILALPFAAIIALVSRFIQAAKRPATSIFFQSGGIPAVLLIGLLTLPITWNLQTIVVAYPVAAAIVALASVVVLVRTVPITGRSNPAFRMTEVLRAGRTLLPANLINKVVRPWTAVLCLGVWGSAIDIAWFSTANRVAALISFAVLPVTTILAPKIAVMYKEGDVDGMYRLSVRATLLIALIALPAILPVIFAPEFIMRIFGEEFAAAAGLLLILAAGQLINAVTGPVQSLLIMTGNEKLHQAASYLGGAVVVALCFWLVPKHGAVGAAWALASSLAVTNLMSLYLVLRERRDQAS